MTDRLPELRASVDRLTALAEPLDDDAIVQPAYPSEWTIAQVLSHIGSGATISRRAVDDAVGGTTTPADFNQGVWDEWNAKAPRAMVDDGLAATRAFVDRMDEIPAEERAATEVAMGPMVLDLDSFVGMRLNEHLLHEWDVAVALDPAATLADDGAAAVVDNLAMIAGFTARPAGEPRTITVATTAPERGFAVTVTEGSVDVAADAPTAGADLTMPAESFIRLVYGRLDPDHTPAAVTGAAGALDQLRAVFPGF